MIRVAISVYDHVAGLQRTLESTRRILPEAHITVVDGAYKQFPHQVPWSTDGTLDVARYLADEVIECPRGPGFTGGERPHMGVYLPGDTGVSRAPHAPWPDEVAKRSAYLTGSDGDLYVVLDADEEIVEGTPGGCLAALTAFAGMDADVHFTRSDDVPPHPLYRVFRHEAGLTYRHTHYALWVGDRCRNWARPRPLLPGFHYLHRIGEYSQNRRECRAHYYDHLKQCEGPYVMVVG